MLPPETKSLHAPLRHTRRGSCPAAALSASLRESQNRDSNKQYDEAPQALCQEHRTRHHLRRFEIACRFLDPASNGSLKIGPKLMSLSSERVCAWLCE